MRRRTAFTLTEILLTLTLFATVSLIAGRIFQSAMRSMASEAEAANHQSAVDQCDRLLRLDAWNATRVDGDSVKIRLQNRDGHAVTWRRNEDQLVRESDTGAERWPADNLQLVVVPLGIALQNAQGQTIRTFLTPLHALEARP